MLCIGFPHKNSHRAIRAIARLASSLGLILLVAVPVFSQIPPGKTHPMYASEIKNPFPKDPALERVISASTGNIRAAFVQIVALHRQGRAQETVLQYRKVLEAAPQNPSLKAQYAFAYLTAVAVFPNDRPSVGKSRVRSALLKDANYLEAQRLRQESLEQLPRSPEARVMAAMFYNYLGQWKKAVDLAREAVSLAPDWSYGHYVLGQSLHGQNGDITDPVQIEANANAALVELQTAEKQNPNLRHWNLYYEYVHVYTALKRYEKALFYLDKIIAAARARNDSTTSMGRLNQWRKSLANRI